MSFETIIRHVCEARYGTGCTCVRANRDRCGTALAIRAVIYALVDDPQRGKSIAEYRHAWQHDVIRLTIEALIAAARSRESKR